MSAETSRNDLLPRECETVMNEIFTRCARNAPNFGITEDAFKKSLRRAVNKYLFAGESAKVTAADIENFLREIQTADLFMALACAAGNERAWWEFDRNHRAYLERVARHLASSEADAQDVVDTVYVELYGTRVVDGERVSKFATYSGRGSLRGWLRTVIWHALVDLHRTNHDEVSLDEMTENVGEGYTHASFAEPVLGGETEMLDRLTRQRYRAATLSAIENAFAALEDHEKLLLLYYHVENLKLREIAKLAATPTSPLRDWFQRKSAIRLENPTSRIHESTIMRWLEKTYGKVLKTFRADLTDKFNLKNEELETCVELATQDLASPDLYRNLITTQN
ncbi:MAG: sigma-70 family RNA polymerase sigma factor [Pyrinomonadaceae bacterium]